MNEQKKLPRPCKGLTFKVKIDNIAIFLRTGDYEDGTLGEIFIDMYKEGAGYKSILANFAILVSWLLQYGVPLDRLVNKFQYTRFEPSGIVIGDDEIKMCSSIIDYVFRRLGITYLNMDLGNVKTFKESIKDGETIIIPSKEELPEFIKDMKSPLVTETKKPPDIILYTFGSGSVGLRPVGYKSEEFLEHCRKNAKGKSVTLEFNDNSIVIFDTPSNIEPVSNIVKSLWYSFYGKTLDLGDL